MKDMYTQTIESLMGSLNLDFELDRKILDIIPKLIEARAKHYAQSGLTARSDSDIMEEERARHWIKGDHGYFAGSYSDGNSGGTPNCSGGMGVISDNGAKLSTSGQKMLTNESSGDKIKTDKVFIHPDKISKFCLSLTGKHSSEFFSVGYKEGDCEKLYRDLLSNFHESKIVDRTTTLNGVEKFSVFKELGVTVKKRFRTVWQKDTPDSQPRFITAHRED